MGECGKLPGTQPLLTPEGWDLTPINARRVIAPTSGCASFRRTATKHIVQIASALVCCMVTTMVATGASANSGPSLPIDDNAITTFIEKALTEKHIPGLSAALIVDGNVIWAKRLRCG